MTAVGTETDNSSLVTVAKRNRTGPKLSREKHHDLLIDLTLILLMVVLPLLALLMSRPDKWGWTFVSVLMAGVVLLWHRHYPLVALVVVALGAAVAQTGSLTMILCVAVFLVAVRSGLATALFGYCIGVVLPLLGTIVKIMLGAFTPPVTSDPPPVGVGTSVVDPYVVVALAAGVAVRHLHQRNQAKLELVVQRESHARAVERSRISTEMHDVIGHALTVMVALSNGARSGWEADPERSRHALDQLGEVGRTALDDMRRTLAILREADDGLGDVRYGFDSDPSSLDNLVDGFREAGLPVHLTQSGEPVPEDAVLTATIYRIVQEGLTNALRHASGATEVTVEIAVCGSEVNISILDDGRPAQASYVGTGRGLIGIATRAASFEGTSSTGPRSPRGWQTRATLRIGQTSD